MYAMKGVGGKDLKEVRKGKKRSLRHWDPSLSKKGDRGLFPLRGNINSEILGRTRGGKSLEEVYNSIGKEATTMGGEGGN